MPAILFASTLKCSDIKASLKTLKGFDDKNILDNVLYHQFKQTGQEKLLSEILSTFPRRELLTNEEETPNENVKNFAKLDLNYRLWQRVFHGKQAFKLMDGRKIHADTCVAWQFVDNCAVFVE